MPRRPTNIATAPLQPPPAYYTNCTIAQSHSGSIDQSRHFFEAHLTNKILNSKTLTAEEKVKFLKIIDGM
jgi:hypothetical protein